MPFFRGQSQPDGESDLARATQLVRDPRRDQFAAEAALGREIKLHSPIAIDVGFDPYQDSELVIWEAPAGEFPEDKVAAPDFARALSLLPRRAPHLKRELIEKAGGIYDRARVADLLGTSPSAVGEQYRRRQFLGVPMGDRLVFPAA